MTAIIPLKARLRAGDMLHGFFLGVPAPATVEMAGWTGFDFVILDGEHGPAGLETMEHMLRAADASGLSALMRVPSGSAADILHALDIGAAGIMVPHVTSAAIARQVVERAYYPPVGRRGIGTLSRAARHGALDRMEYLKGAAERTLVTVMIEDAEALPHVRDIAQVDGVDVLFVGPSDLAASLGHPGESTHPEVVAALERILRDAGDVPVATTAGSAAEARRLAGLGVRMACFSTTSIMVTALRQLRRDLDQG
ncbi:aldolase/citrate lyase family protein [Roseomonas sp. CAU 1739]|uniref:HpcH/HpaI aldolase family protein n=1 Tax=Roseomonas sp. CAU 1739 TaxID=3140364 RepID=UPI00325BAFC5